MNSREDNNLNQLLEEDFDSHDSNISIIDDSDADTDFHPPGVAEKGSTRTSPDVSNYLSDDKYSTEVSTPSDENENNDEDTEWVDDNKTISDFQFNSNLS